MAGVHTIRGIHMEWDDATGPNDTKDLAIGWAERSSAISMRFRRRAMLLKQRSRRFTRRPSQGLCRCKPARRRPNHLDIFPNLASTSE
jgi:hypothetical protein